MMKRSYYYLVLWLSAVVTAGAAVEYFVATDGSDGADGRSRSSAFGSIQHGVDVLQPGDTLTILPGEYFEHVSREGLGSADAVTTIRAAIAGTVLLRGDVAAPEFERVAGTRFTWQAPFDQAVQAVNELDTLTILLPVGGVDVLDYQPGGFYYDAEAGVLKISTSDLQPPDAHSYRIAVTNAHGLHLERPVRVVVEGLAATGFNRASGGANYPGYTARWGFLFGSATDSVIRNCTAFLNGGGIALHNRDDAGGNLIEGCVAYANYCRANNGGNILGYSPNRDLIRNSYSFRTRLNGIRLYGGGKDDNHHIGNLAWGSGWSDINTKGTHGRVERTIAVGAGNVLDTHHSLIGGVNSKHFAKETPRDTIRLMQEVDLDPNAEFADPANMDFRLQSTSRFRNAAPDGSDRGPLPFCGTVFYVGPDGDDAADGQSLATAWRTLARAVQGLSAGDTLYLSGGVYSGGLHLNIPGDGDGGLVTLRGRGADDVLIKGPVVLQGGTGFSLGRIQFADTVSVVGCGQLRVRNVFFGAAGVGMSLQSVRSASIRQAVFARASEAGMRVDDVPSLFVSGTLFNTGAAPAIVFDQPIWQVEDVFYSDYNSYGSAAAIWQVGGRRLALEDVRRSGSDRHSQVQPAQIVDDAGLVRIGNPRDFSSGGPLGFGIGHYRETRFLEQQAELAKGPEVHSTSATSANIEWWAPQSMVFDLSWGTSPELGESIRFEGSGFNTQSITGLQPGTKYYFRLRTAIKRQVPSAAAIPTPDVHVMQGAADGQERFIADFSESTGAIHTFTTPAGVAEPRFLHVATNGDDGNDGLSAESPLRTINRAAELVRPGDTVMIGGGNYYETVRARVTGTREAPIRFASMPGERAVIDGAERSLSGNLIIDGKEHLEFDRLWMAQSGGTAVQINRGGHHLFSRCFLDGRGRGNAPWALRAVDANGVVLRNCVINHFFSGFHVTHCADFTVEHCVFTRNWIFIANVYNGENESFIFRNNIVTENQPDKRTVPFFEICFASSMVKGDNAYYIRPQEGQRPIFFIIDQPGDEPHTRNRMQRLSLQEFNALYGESGSIFANPEFPVWADVDTTALTRAGEPVFPADVMPRGNLDFSDFFTTNPILVERNIGLQKEAF